MSNEQAQSAAQQHQGDINLVLSMLGSKEVEIMQLRQALFLHEQHIQNQNKQIAALAAELEKHTKPAAPANKVIKRVAARKK